MIGSLRGTVVERNGDSTVLFEVGGVGYLVHVTPRTLAELEPTSQAFMHVYHHIREDALIDIVATNDHGALTLVPGVGKKTAERLLIELRGKLQLPVLDAMVDGKSTGTSVMTDVREALTGLGYSSEEIREVLRDLSASDTAENVLRQALNALGVRRA